MPQRGAFIAVGQRLEHVFHLTTVEEVHIGRPGARRIVAIDCPHPVDLAAGASGSRGQAVDVGHDRFTIGRICRHALLDPNILHIDDHQRRCGGIQGAIGVQLAAPPACHAGNYIGR